MGRVGKELSHAPFVMQRSSSVSATFLQIWTIMPQI
jgi:hypothetical protein